VLHKSERKVVVNSNYEQKNMDSSSLTDYLLNKLKEPDKEGLKGIDLSVHVPVHVSLLNSFLNTLTSNSRLMKDVREIVLSEADKHRFRIKLEHKRIKKELFCGIRDIEYNPNKEPLLTIEFLEGLRSFEKFVLTGIFIFKKSWSVLKAVFNDEDRKALEASQPFWDLSGSKLVVNLSKLLREQHLDYIDSILHWQGISTKNNCFIFDIKIKT